MDLSSDVRLACRILGNDSGMPKGLPVFQTIVGCNSIPKAEDPSAKFCESRST